MKIDLIAGTRPNFVKIVAIIHAIETYGPHIKYRFIHTGQHYDKNLSGNFFKDLEIPSPEINLQVGSGSQAEQTGAIMLAYENLLRKEKSDICLVVGDVTSSMACAITAKKMGLKIVHVEAGLRSYDWSMPEEINRILIDSITDYFFTTTLQASENLFKTGKNKEQVFFVGNTMIDTLLRFKTKFQKPEIWDRLYLKKGDYLILTLHRPANVDEEKQLEGTINCILENSNNLPVIFPVHPRTKAIIKSLNFKNENLFLIEPLGYLHFNYLVANAKAVLTDSGGITEETTVLNVPCITLRENTERPETIELGTHILAGTQTKAIKKTLEKLFSDPKLKTTKVPDLWDGNAGKRIVSILSGKDFSF